MKKAYYHEHLAGYAQMKARGLESWGAVHGNPDFDEFSSKAFLEGILPRLQLAPGARVLELGCGTGPGACLLARRGFRVHGIDLIPDAIEAARRAAAERGFDISYEVMDMTQMPSPGEPYDLIVDSYATQGVVFAPDRERMFAGVDACLTPRGYLVSSCCVYEAERINTAESFSGEDGTVYMRHDKGGLWDDATEIAYARFGPNRYLPEAGPEDYDGMILVAGEWYIPVRCYRRPDNLRAELESHGFSVLLQSGDLHENCVAVHAGSDVDLNPETD